MSRTRTSAINGLIAIDKPAGMTSHDVVARLRRAIHERRVGHAGTLDPLATGVLICGIGVATRLMGFLTQERKGYEALVRFGTQTTTDDAEGEPLFQGEVPQGLADEAQARPFVAALEGSRMQVPPAFSAISKDGKRAYALAREGKAPELDPREVSIYSSQLLGVEGSVEGTGPDALGWRVSLEVSKGCYIRAIARDLGRDLGCGAHIAELRRSSSGLVDLSSCVSLEDVLEGGVDFVRERLLDPVAALGLPTRELSASELEDLRCGRSLGLGPLRIEEGQRASLVDAQGLWGIWERSGNRLKSSASFPVPIEGVK